MTTGTIHVLLVDDDPGDLALTRKLLAGTSASKFQVTTADSLVAAQGELDGGRFDVVLLDLGLPESSGLETLSTMRDSCSEVPIVVLTGLDDASTALASLDKGAQDYLPKGDITTDTLNRSIRYAIQRNQLRFQLGEANELLESKNRRLSQLYATAQQFVDNVSHEFRTPLTVIREFTSIVRDGLDGPVTEQQQQRLSAVMVRSDDLAHMVDDMLDISKLEAGLLSVWRRPCKVKDILQRVESVIERRALARNLTLKVSVEENLPDVFCDDEKIQRVIINLAVNAIKFTPEGGTVLLWARSLDNSQISVGVTDDGPGISAENRDLIFERFQQVGGNLRSSTKGFGLGLNIAKELVQLNLGKMDVQSEVGAGSTFSFTLPLTNVESLFEHCCDQLVNWPDQPDAVSLLAATIPAHQSVEAAPVIDEFLQHLLRSYDLVVQTNSTNWLMLTSCPSMELHELLQRVHTEWQDFTRNYPHGDLPSISLDILGTWKIPSERQWFTKAIHEALHGEPRNLQETIRVLIVDDDQEVAEGLGVRLKSAGYEVVSATNGRLGIEAVMEQQPAAVIMDIRMPEMDGISALQHLKSSPDTLNTPIIMLSASVRDQQDALDKGASYFVQKPYEIRTVLDALKCSLEPPPE